MESMALKEGRVAANVLRWTYRRGHPCRVQRERTAAANVFRRQYSRGYPGRMMKRQGVLQAARCGRAHPTIAAATAAAGVVWGDQTWELSRSEGDHA